MVSKRKRSQRSVGSQLNALQTTAETVVRRAEAGPEPASIPEAALQENSVGTTAIKPNAVTSEAIAPGAVGTKELGTVNQINTESALVLTGPTYTPSSTGYPLVFNSSGQMVPATAGIPETKVINGDFSINQRAYVSGTALTPGLLSGYCFDRWKTSGLANLAINPTARTAATYWIGQNISAATRITGVVIPGRSDITTAVRGTISVAANGGLYMPSDAGTSGTPFLTVKPGNIYRISAWLRASVAKVVQPSAQLYNAGSMVGTVSATSTVSLVANTWTLVSWTMMPPNGANRMGPYWYSTVAWAIGNTLDVAGVTITEGTDVVPFFDGSFPDSSWVGTADASTSINRPVRTTVTYTSAPQGQAVTVNSLGAIQQVIEQRELVAGNYTLSHAGSGWMRVYNRTATVIPAYTAGPLTVAIDGTDDVVVEFGLPSAGAFTVDRVQFVSGTAAYPFQAKMRTDELLLCQRYYIRITGGAVSSRLSTYGAQASTSVAETVYNLPTPLRGSFTSGSSPRIVPEHSGAAWSDGATFTQALQADGWSGVTSDHLYNAGQSLSVLAWLNSTQGAAFRTGVISANVAGGWVAFHGEFY